MSSSIMRKEDTINLQIGHRPRKVFYEQKKMPSSFATSHFEEDLVLNSRNPGTKDLAHRIQQPILKVTHWGQLLIPSIIYHALKKIKKIKNKHRRCICGENVLNLKNVEVILFWVSVNMSHIKILAFICPKKCKLQSRFEVTSFTHYRSAGVF